MIRTIARGLLVAVLTVACSDVAPTTAPLAPSLRPGLALGLPNNAQADTLVVGSTRQLSAIMAGAATSGPLRDAASGRCLAVVGASRVAGGALTLASCASNAEHQMWTFDARTPSGPITVFGGTLCLDNWGARGKIGDVVGTWTCVPNATTQSWELDGMGQLRMANGLCVQANGTQEPTLQACNGAAEQRWLRNGTPTVLAWSSSAPSVASVSATGLVSALAPGRAVITASSGATSESATIVVAAALPAATPTPVQAMLVSATGECLTIRGDAAASLVPATTQACQSATGQRWSMMSVGGSGPITVFAGQQCLDDWGANGQVGDKLGTWQCVANAPTQRWTLTVAGELRGVNSLCVQAGASGQQVTLESCTGGANQRWTASVLATVTPSAPAPTPTLPAPSPAPVPPPTATMPATPAGAGPVVPSAAPELPRTTVDTRMPTPTGRTIAVPAGGDLQAAFVAARPGDVITLANGATYRGNFELPDKAAGGWIVVRPASLSGLPAEGERLAPVRHAAQMPKIVSPNAMFAISTPDRNANTGTRGWRFVGIEIASNESVAIAQAIVQLGEGNETSLGKVPSHIVLDRVWIHGRPQQYVSRCLTLNSAHTAVIDSYLSECHTRGGEGQVIGGWGSPGPLRIENNYLEGGTIGMLVGGADPNIQGLIPSDITVRRNHFFKPLAWKGVYQVKNSFELKNAQRVLVEGNVFENNWQDAQSGYMILFTPLSQANLAPWTTVRDVTFRNNLLRNSDQGFMIAARNAYTSAGLAPVQLNEVTKRVLIENNVLDRVGGRAFMVYNETEDVTIAHNVSNGADFGFLLLGDSTKAPAARLVLRDNLMSRGYTLINGDGTGQGSIALSAYARGAVVAGNLVYSSIEPGLGRVNLFPTSNNFVELPALAGITSATILGAPVANAQVTLGSLFYRSGTGGSTPGANLTALNAAIANVVQQ